MREELNFIGGHWVRPDADRWVTVENPSYGTPIGRVPDSTQIDADAAVRAAREAFDEGPWPQLPARERRDMLIALGDELVSRMDAFNELIPQEAGCPRRLSDMMQVAVGIGQVYDFAEHALLLEQVKALPITEAPTFGQSEVRREPVGVCVGFSPFNFPLLMNIWKVIPAIAMGNTVVLKPSPLTPLSSVELARACETVGIPPGVVNIVHGDVEAGAALTEHRGVDHVSFTGSTAVGRKVMAAAAGTIKRVTLELGGKSPSIVLEDADLELAIRGTLFGSMMHAGQACVAPTRLLLPANRYDEAIDLLRERALQLKLGVAEDVSTDVGPVISAAQLEKIERHVATAIEQGAKVLVGGERRTDVASGHFFEPTVLVDVSNEMSIACEEVFGPVLSVIRYNSVDEAVRAANDSDYGLAAVVWGGDLNQARGVAGRLRAGTVWVNDFGVLTPSGPFGGYRQSGIGRENGPEGALEYTEVKHLYTALDADVARRSYGLVGLDWD